MDSTEVRVLPAEVTFPVEAGENVMAAAGRAGLTWPTLCRGKAKCAVCAVTVLDGAERVSPVASAERLALRTYRGIDSDRDPLTRLACQMQVTGPVVVRKPGVRSAVTDPRES